MNLIFKYSLIVFVSAVGVTGQLLLRKGLSSFNNLQFDNYLIMLVKIIFQPVIILALFCYGFGLIAYMFLVSKIQVTAVYPITTSLTFGGITLFGYFLLGESLTLAKIAGIILIIIGIVLIDRFG
ncbi:hypothetical protein ACFL60_06020 [Candidatus Omnitrophota bacterium]